MATESKRQPPTSKKQSLLAPPKTSSSTPRQCPRCGAYPKHTLQPEALHLRPVPLRVTRRMRFARTPLPLRCGSMSLEMFYLCQPERKLPSSDTGKERRRGTLRMQKLRSRTNFNQMWTVYHSDRYYLSGTPEWHRTTALKLAQITKQELPGLASSIQSLINDPSFYSVICWDVTEPHSLTGVREATIVGGSICTIDQEHGFAQIFSLAIDKQYQGMSLGRQTYHVSHLFALTNKDVYVSVTESCHSKLRFWLGKGKYTAVNQHLKLEDHPLLADLTHPSRYIDHVLRSKNSVLCSFPLRPDSRPPIGTVNPKRASCGKKVKEVDKLSEYFRESFSRGSTGKRKFQEVSDAAQTQCRDNRHVIGGFKPAKREYLYASSPNSGFQRQVYFTTNPRPARQNKNGKKWFSGC